MGKPTLIPSFSRTPTPTSSCLASFYRSHLSSSLDFGFGSTCHLLQSVTTLRWSTIRVSVAPFEDENLFETFQQGTAHVTTLAEVLSVARNGQGASHTELSTDIGCLLRSPFFTSYTLRSIPLFVPRLAGRTPHLTAKRRLLSLMIFAQRVFFPQTLESTDWSSLEDETAKDIVM